MRSSIRRISILMLALLACAVLTQAVPAEQAQPAKKIPVILDTDIGDDIDDTWALGLLLRSPELDLKLAVGDQGRPEYRASLIAKFLERAGRTDVPVGVGIDANRTGVGPQAAWVKDYDLKKYPGKVHEDGVQAIIDTIMKSPEPITLICIGPVPNIAEALKREPRIAEHARFVGMHGSVRVGYNGGKEISAEYNVRGDAKAAQAAFTAKWPMRITPLDTCGLVRLKGEKYQTVRDSTDPIARTIIENYRIWSKDPKTPDSQSSVLFDTVAVYLAFRDDFVRIEELPIAVTDKGFTEIRPGAKMISVATEWKDMGAYEDFLVRRVTGAGQ